jgi:hypothetical protein
VLGVAGPCCLVVTLAGRHHKIVCTHRQLEVDGTYPGEIYLSPGPAPGLENSNRRAPEPGGVPEAGVGWVAGVSQSGVGAGC